MNELFMWFDENDAPLLSDFGLQSLDDGKYNFRDKTGRLLLLLTVKNNKVVAIMDTSKFILV